MFQKILVPLDGSPLSEEVLPAVKRLLEGGSGEATLFMTGEAPHATRKRRTGLRRSVPIVATPGSFVDGLIRESPPSYAETKDQAIERREHELLEYLAEAGRSLLETGRPVYAAVHFGDPAKEIVALAKRQQFDLIAMATHGRSGLRETLQGSVTSEVIRSGVAPVLVIRPRKRRTRRKS